MILSQTAAFLVTLGVEGPAAFLLARTAGADRRFAAVAAVLGSAMTHPFVWIGVTALTQRIGSWSTPLLETAAILAEACVYRAIATPAWRSAFILSAAVNLLSWGLGAALHALA